MSRDKAKTVGLFHRQATVELIPREEGSDSPPELKLSFSSDIPYRRQTWGGYKFDEVLSHKPGDIDLSKMDGAPFLDSHWLERESVLGVIKAKSAKTDGHRATAVVRLDTEADGYAAFNRHLEMGMDKVSVGYRVHKWKTTLAAERTDGVTDADLKVATSWTPHEASSVLVPADDSVGIGRSGNPEVVDRRTEVVQSPHQVGEPTSTQPSQEREMPPEDRTETETETRSQTPPAAPATPTPAPAAPALSVVDNGNSEAARMLALGRQFQSVDGLAVAAQAIEAGKSEADLREELQAKLLAKYAEATAPEAAEQRASEHNIGMTSREIEGFSFMRAFSALAFPDQYGERGAFELEAMRTASREAEARGIPVNGSYRLPSEVMHGPFMPRSLRNTELVRRYTRALQAGDATAQDLVATVLDAGSFIDFLYVRSVVLPRATVIGDLVGNLDIPRTDAVASASWGAEAAAVNPADAPQFDKISLSPKRMQVSVEITREAMRQTTPDVEMLVRNDFGMAMRNGLDSVAINGGGSDQPSGVLQIPTGSAFNQAYARPFTPSTDDDGVDITWPIVVSLESEVAAENADVGTMAYVCNSRLAGLMKTTEKATNYPVYLNEGGQVNGYPLAITNQSALDHADRGAGTGLSHLLFGNFADLLVGMWGGTDFLVNPYSKDTQAITRITAYQLADLAVRHGESFAWVPGVKTS